MIVVCCCCVVFFWTLFCVLTTKLAFGCNAFCSCRFVFNAKLNENLHRNQEKLLQNHFELLRSVWAEIQSLIVLFKQNVAFETNPMKCDKSNGKLIGIIAFEIRFISLHYILSNIFRLFASFTSFTSIDRNIQGQHISKDYNLQFNILWFYIANTFHHSLNLIRKWLPKRIHVQTVYRLKMVINYYDWRAQSPNGNNFTL